MSARAWIALAALVAAPCMAPAAVLYKSISPTGVVEFSDVPPSDRSVIVEARAVGSLASTAPAAASDLPPRGGTLDGLPYVVEDAGGALARANAQLDLAEHALAEALRSLGSPLQDMRLKTQAAGSSNAARIDFFRRNVQAARDNLMNVLRAQAAGSSPTLASR
jgi:hypothetical protein